MGEKKETTQTQPVIYIVPVDIIAALQIPTFPKIIQEITLNVPSHLEIKRYITNTHLDDIVIAYSNALTLNYASDITGETESLAFEIEESLGNQSKHTSNKKKKQFNVHIQTTKPFDKEITQKIKIAPKKKKKKSNIFTQLSNFIQQIPKHKSKPLIKKKKEKNTIPQKEKSVILPPAEKHISTNTISINKTKKENSMENTVTQALKTTQAQQQAVFLNTDEQSNKPANLTIKETEIKGKKEKENQTAQETISTQEEQTEKENTVNTVILEATQLANKEINAPIPIHINTGVEYILTQGGHTRTPRRSIIENKIIDRIEGITWNVVLNRNQKKLYKALGKFDIPLLPADHFSLYLKQLPEGADANVLVLALSPSTLWGIPSHIWHKLTSYEEIIFISLHYQQRHFLALPIYPSNIAAVLEALPRIIQTYTDINYTPVFVYHAEEGNVNIIKLLGKEYIPLKTAPDIRLALRIAVQGLVPRAVYYNFHRMLVEVLEGDMDYLALHKINDSLTMLPLDEEGEEIPAPFYEWSVHIIKPTTNKYRLYIEQYNMLPLYGSEGLTKNALNISMESAIERIKRYITILAYNYYPVYQDLPLPE